MENLNFQNYFVMVIFVLIFYTLVKRNGFSKKKAIASLIFDIAIFAVLIFYGQTNIYLLMQFIPTFFFFYCIIHFFGFCFKKSFGSVTGIRDLFKKRKKFKEMQKVAQTNKHVKTYKGAKKKN